MVSLPTSRQTHAFVTNVHNTAVNNKDVKPSSGGHKEPVALVASSLYLSRRHKCSHTRCSDTPDEVFLPGSWRSHYCVSNRYTNTSTRREICSLSSHSITVTLAAARDPSKLHYADINRRVTYWPLMGQNRARPCYLLNTIKLWPSSSPPSKAQGDNKCWLINNWSVRTVAGSVDQVTVGS